MNHLKSIFGIIWLTVLICIIFYTYNYGNQNDLTFVETLYHFIDYLKSFISGAGLWAVALYVLIYTIRPLVFFPTSILTPLSAVLFGPLAAWVYTYIGENLSASVAFFTARYFGQKHTSRFNIFKKINKITDEAPLMTVLFLRLVPLFPFDIVNFGMGITNIRYKWYLIGTLLGVIPGLTAYIFLGASITEPRLLIPTIILFIILSTIAWFVKKNSKLIQKITKSKKI